MNILLAANMYFSSMCAFIAIMCVVGFLLIRTDKKRWKKQQAHSDAIMQASMKMRASHNASSDTEDTAQKKKRQRKPSVSHDEPFEYKERIPDKVIFIVAFFFGAVGVFLGMLIYRHKWYKFSFRAYIPILTLVNIVLGAVLLYALYSRGETNSLVNF